jgi:hypothetical protein
MFVLCENTQIGFHHYDDMAQVEDCRKGSHEFFASRPIDEHVESVGVAWRRRNILTVGVEGGDAVTSTPSQRPGLRVVGPADAPDDPIPDRDESDPETGPKIY